MFFGFFVHEHKETSFELEMKNIFVSDEIQWRKFGK